MAKFSKFEKKLLKKISDDRYIQSLGNIREAMEDLWSPDIPRIVPYFTDHGIKHSENLARIAYQILLTGKNSLSEKELYLLLAGIFLHDIGMQCDVPIFDKIKIKALEYKAEHIKSEQEPTIITEDMFKELNTPKGIRENHNYLSAAWIDYAYKNRSDPIFGKALSNFPENIHIDDLIDVCLYHSKLDLNQCTEKLRIGDKDNKQLVAALLRLSDELDIDINRVSSPMILKCFNMDPDNLKYWWLHRYTNISFIDGNKISIVIRLNPVDIDRCGEYIKYKQIEIFKFKNRPIIDILVGCGFTIVLKDYYIAGDTRSEMLPAEIAKVLQYQKQESPVDRSDAEKDSLRKKEAIKLYNEAIVTNPEDSAAWNNKGVMLFELGFYKDALVCYNIALQLKPNDAEYWNNKGNTLSYLGKFKEAIKCYDNAIKIVPNYSNAWYNKGNTLSYLESSSSMTSEKKKSILEEELKCFDKVTKLEPVNTNALSNKGNILFRINRKKEAIKCYDKALKIDINHANTWYNKGYALNDLGDKKGAIECFDQVIKLDPKNISAWFDKGNALNDLGDKKGAIECFDQVIKLDPNDKYVWYNKGIVYSKLKDTDNELECYYKSIEQNPLDTDSWFNIGEIYIDLKKYIDALKIFNLLLAINNKDFDSWQNKGYVLSKLGREDEAIECYEFVK